MFQAFIPCLLESCFHIRCEIPDCDLEVNHIFSCQTRHRRGAYMIDPQRQSAQGLMHRAGYGRKFLGPLGLIINDDYWTHIYHV